MQGKISNRMQVCSLVRYTVTDGRMLGLRVIECDNGKLRFLLNESKALDVMQLFHEGENLSFVSKNGFSLRQIPFEKRFEGGMLYTCGLDCVGAKEGLETHGSLHNTPAEVFRAECTDEGIVVEAEVRDSALFGKNLLLKRRISTKAYGDSLEIEDVLVNEGTRGEEYALLYHVNLGYPFLDEGGKISADVRSVEGRTPWAQAHIGNWTEIVPPKENEEEMCYYARLVRPEISYVNPARHKKFTLTYEGEDLSRFIVWKSMSCGDYALGLEPTTTELDDRFGYARIEKGERKRFRITLTVKREES